MAETPANIDSEVWKDIPGWDGYQASSLGRIRSLDRVVIKTIRGIGRRIAWKGRIYKAVPHYKNGYMKVCIKGADGKPKTPFVHSLVCRAFHGRKPDGHDVAHEDGVKSNNRADNLRWATRKENCADKWKHGTMAIGERCGTPQLTERKVLEIKRLLKLGVKQTEIARMVGTDSRRVSDINLRKKWAYLE